MRLVNIERPGTSGRLFIQSLPEVVFDILSGKVGIKVSSGMCMVRNIE